MAEDRALHWSLAAGSSAHDAGLPRTTPAFRARRRPSAHDAGLPRTSSAFRARRCPLRGPRARRRPLPPQQRSSSVDSTADGGDEWGRRLIFCERFTQSRNSKRSGQVAKDFSPTRQQVAAFDAFSIDRSRAGGCSFVQGRSRDPDRWSRISSSARQQVAAFGFLPLLEAGQEAVVLFGNSSASYEATAGG
ncbi:hypothetical protein AXF42_Ash019552 [Apostasia shenzhenica]|uniref:Uncharacterized protein n=1 Tax=Apostasia shenzhenica TaxID=1088818 RepID=A0A2I0AV31_9ASPA|nr:hypothetical protein AXF42_Ash019552 [Apostasia shenzhenica]